MGKFDLIPGKGMDIVGALQGKNLIIIEIIVDETRFYQSMK